MRDQPTQQISLNRTYLPRPPWRIIAAGTTVTVIWIATLTVAVVHDHDLVMVALALAVTGSLSVVAWACTICNGRVVAGRHRVLHVQLNTLFAALGENHAVLERISAKLDRDDWDSYAEAVRDLAGADKVDAEVVPIGRGRGWHN